MNSRLKNILSQLKKQNLDGLLVSSEANISYLTESQSRDSYFLVSPKGNFYFTDYRYLQEARITLGKNAKIKEVNASVFKTVAETIRKLKLKRVGFEERHLIFAEHKKIKEGLTQAIQLIPIHGLIEELRQIKEPQEIEKIKKAVSIAAAALDFVKEILSPGKKEIEVVGELEHFIRYKGGHNHAFDIIVASGANSCYPHHIPGERRLGKNEPVLIDIGVDYSGYKSDLTRVFFLGKIKVLARKVYEIVKEANSLAIKKIRPGERIGKIDIIARHYIAKNGWGGFFRHSLGHGIGLEVHEDPRIYKDTDQLLKPGMVFTIEPAIYLPGEFGVRIEDMALVTENGCEVLSGALHK